MSDWYENKPWQACRRDSPCACPSSGSGQFGMKIGPGKPAVGATSVVARLRSAYIFIAGCAGRMGDSFGGRNPVRALSTEAPFLISGGEGGNPHEILRTQRSRSKNLKSSSSTIHPFSRTDPMAHERRPTLLTVFRTTRYRAACQSWTGSNPNVDLIRAYTCTTLALSTTKSTTTKTNGKTPTQLSEVPYN